MPALQVRRESLRHHPLELDMDCPRCGERMRLISVGMTTIKKCVHCGHARTVAHFESML